MHTSNNLLFKLTAAKAALLATSHCIDGPCCCCRLLPIAIHRIIKKRVHGDLLSLGLCMLTWCQSIQPDFRGAPLLLPHFPGQSAAGRHI